jgi:hypothetical protein
LQYTKQNKMKINKTTQNKVLVFIALIALGVGAFSDETFVIGHPKTRTGPGSYIFLLIAFICICWLEINNKNSGTGQASKSTTKIDP